MKYITTELQPAIATSYQAACSFATSSEPEAALEALEECFDAGDLDVERWHLDPDLDGLRDDERFRALLGKMDERARQLSPARVW